LSVQENSKSSYRPEIDGLRAIAVFSVIVTHAGEPFAGILPGGFLGVDVFFVLSGFLITGIISREALEGRFSLKLFYERRTRRILPALIFVSFVSLLGAWVLMSPNQLAAFSQSLVGLVLFASNIYFWLTSGYFAPSSETQAMIHTWSLAVEEQFYLFFPLIFMMLWNRKWVLPGLFLMLAIGIIVADVMARTMPSAAFYLLPARAWELLAGSLAGYMAVRFGLPDGSNGPLIWRSIGKNRNALSWVGLCAVTMPLFLYHSGMTIPGLPLTVPVGGTVLVLLCVQPKGQIYWFLTRSPMVWVGLISYSAYLWHQPVFAFARLSQVGPVSPWTMAILTLVVLGLAWLTWVYVEGPFRSRNRSFRPIAFMIGGAMGILGAIGLMGHLREGFAHERFAPDVVAAFDTASPSPFRDKCHNKPVGEACQYFGNQTPTWAVFGDSHGVEIAYALAKQIEGSDESLLHYTAPGCPPALLFETSASFCSDWTQGVLEDIEAQEERITVVLTYRHTGYLFGKNEAGFPNLPDTPEKIVSGDSKTEKRSLYWQSFTEIVKRLRAAEHRVVLLLPVPEIGHGIEKRILMDGLAAGSPIGETGSHLVSVPRSYYDNRSSSVRERLAMIAATDPEIELLDPVESFCNLDDCFAVRNGKSYYFDDDHPSIYGATRIVQQLTAK